MFLLFFVIFTREIELLFVLTYQHQPKLVLKYYKYKLRLSFFLPCSYFSTKFQPQKKTKKNRVTHNSIIITILL